jgi:hypothetical protein
MDKQKWQVLKSRRDLAHRTERKRKKEGELQHQRETPAHLKGMAPAKVQMPAEKVVVETPKIVEKTGIFRRMFRRMTGS